MNLQAMFINSLYLLGIALVVAFITQLILTVSKEVMIQRTIKKSLKSGDFKVIQVKKDEEECMK